MGGSQAPPFGTEHQVPQSTIPAPSTPYVLVNGDPIPWFHVHHLRPDGFDDAARFVSGYGFRRTLKGFPKGNQLLPAFL